VEQALGNGIKEPSESEKKNISIARKSIHTSKALKKGEILTEDSFIMLRPGDGISPVNVDALLGKRLLRNLKAGHKINYTDFTS
jgi:sialic acid synthase SpsE